MKPLNRRTLFLASVVLLLSILWFAVNQDWNPPHCGDVLITKIAPSSFDDGLVFRINNKEMMLGRSSTRSATWNDRSRRQATQLPDRFIGDDLNTLGWIAGAWRTPNRGEAAVLSPWNSLTTIPTPAGNARAYGINDMGQVVGVWWSQSGGRNGFYWDAEKGLVLLTELIGVPRLCPNGLNDRGEIVGQQTTVNGCCAFLWSPQAGLISLPITSSSCACAVNNASQIVGYYEGESHRLAFYWSAEHGFIDLNTLLPPGSGWELNVAWDLNDRGQIVGYGRINNEFSDFLLTLPEYLRPKPNDLQTTTSRRPAAGAAAPAT